MKKVLILAAAILLTAFLSQQTALAALGGDIENAIPITGATTQKLTGCFAKTYFKVSVPPNQTMELITEKFDTSTFTLELYDTGLKKITEFSTVEALPFTIINSRDLFEGYLVVFKGGSQNPNCSLEFTYVPNTDIGEMDAPEEKYEEAIELRAGSYPNCCSVHRLNSDQRDLGNIISFDTVDLFKITVPRGYTLGVEATAETGSQVAAEILNAEHDSLDWSGGSEEKPTRIEYRAPVTQELFIEITNQTPHYGLTLSISKPVELCEPNSFRCSDKVYEKCAEDGRSFMYVEECKLDCNKTETQCALTTADMIERDENGNPIRAAAASGFIGSFLGGPKAPLFWLVIGGALLLIIVLIIALAHRKPKMIASITPVQNQQLPPPPPPTNFLKYENLSYYPG